MSPSGETLRYDFYQRLRSAGKTHKLALTACMLKLIVILKALIKHRTPWALPAVDLIIASDTGFSRQLLPL